MEAIPTLPNDLFRWCLLKVPYKFHNKLKSVCRSWKDIMGSPQFYEDRKTYGNSEQFICLVQRVEGDVYEITVYDAVKDAWQRLSPFPYSPGIPHSCKLVSVNRKLVLIGGWQQSKPSWRVAKTVFIYDFESAKWNRGSDMPTLRESFACSVSSSTGLIYVAGGHNVDGDLASAEVYDVKKDKWENLPPMIENRSACKSVFLGGNFMVLSGRWTWQLGRYKKSAEVFNPNLGTWSRLEDMWSLGERLRTCAFVVFSEKLYVFWKDEVMDYDPEKNVWTAVAILPHPFYSFICAVQYGDRIFVNGLVRRQGFSMHGIAEPEGPQMSYLFQPSTGKFIAVDGGEEFAGKVLSAATLEI